MGPRHFSRGSRRAAEWLGKPKCGRLQWGHGISAVEVISSNARGMVECPLQWGHGISAVEVSQRRCLWRKGVASMGPRHFSRGSLGRRNRPILAATASMGPRHFSRGSSRAGVLTEGRGDGFNGATAFQPWKSGGGGLGRIVDKSFNGATAFQPWKSMDVLARIHAVRLLQWGHGISAVEVSRDGGRRYVSLAASMGPRHFSRGSRRASGRLQDCRTGFNGATAFQPWKWLIISPSAP